MSSCKECVHYEVCKIFNNGRKENIDAYKDVDVFCRSFKSKSRFVELPCEVGQMMWKLCTVNSRIKIGQMWDGIIVKNNCDRCGYRNCSCYDIGLMRHECDTMIDIVVQKEIRSIEFALKIKPYVGTIWFHSKEEAEKAIEMLKAEYEEAKKNNLLCKNL